MRRRQSALTLPPLLRAHACRCLLTCRESAAHLIEGDPIFDLGSKLPEAHLREVRKIIGHFVAEKSIVAVLQDLRQVPGSRGHIR